jgi:hypothetical protein
VAFLADGKVVAVDTPRALKLELSGGAPQVDVVLDDGAEVAIRLGEPLDAALLQELLGAERVRTVHSREPTLADVFIQLTGRTLAEDAVLV